MTEISEVSAETQGKRSRGRPARRPEMGYRRNYGFRMTDQLRDHLARAAEVAGRSLSEEVEHRLERSFWEDGLRTLVVEAVREAKS